MSPDRRDADGSFYMPDRAPASGSIREVMRGAGTLGVGSPLMWT